MFVSEARIAANRRNSQKSTGPVTDEGKAASRRNALKHGLTATTLVLEDAEAVQVRADAWYHALKPQTYYHAWLTDEIAVLTLRADHCQRIERRIRQREALRAEICWDDDRRLEADRVGSGLARDPARVVERLMGSPQGCDWMIGRWALLASAAREGEWSPDQRELALDLLCTAPEFRKGEPGVQVNLQGERVATADPLALALGEIERLQRRKAEVEDLDEADKILATRDVLAAPTDELKRLRRYEASLQRRLRWCHDQFKYVSPHRAPHPDLRPNFADRPEVANMPEKAPERHQVRPAEVPVETEVVIAAEDVEVLEAELEVVEAPVECVVEVAPAEAPSRKELRERRAASRREAKSRKRERQLA